jgi:hypothetical protein
MSDTLIDPFSPPLPSRSASRAEHVYFGLRDDIFEMRKLIETFAIGKLVSEAPPLSGVVLQMLGEAFHYALVCAAGNEELTNSMQRVADRILIPSARYICCAQLYPTRTRCQINS